MTTGVDPIGKEFTRFLEMGTERLPISRLDESLNKLGDQYWELVSVTGSQDR